VAESWAQVSFRTIVSDAFVSGCASQDPVFHVRLSDDGLAIDQDFQFIVVGV
jgi:hypothetical protein